MWVGGCLKQLGPLGPLGLCTLALGSGEVRSDILGFKPPQENQEALPRKLAGTFPYFSVLLSFWQPCAFDLKQLVPSQGNKQPCARGVPLGTSVRWDMPPGCLCEKKGDKTKPSVARTLRLVCEKLFDFCQVRPLESCRFGVGKVNLATFEGRNKLKTQRK